jgi:ATP-dependent exoDNAse (exonuclease V) beta subunit
MQANQEALASGGYYGSGIKTFLAWLAGRAKRENGQPEPRVIDEEAIQLITWHRSKGREWPVVIVSSTDCPVKPRLPDYAVVYEDFTDLGAVLDNALIEISPDFDAKETEEIFIDRLFPDTIDGAGRLLYVALTRAREKLILEWSEYQSKSKAKSGSFWSLLKAKTAMNLAGTVLTVGGESFECLVATYPGGISVEGGNMTGEEVREKLPEIGRRAITLDSVPVGLTPEGVSPSSLHDEYAVGVDNLETSCYGDLMKLELSLEGAARGSLLHRCFELLSEGDMDADTLSTITGYKFSQAEVNVIAKAANNFESWFADRLNPLHTAREIPLLALNSSGSVINGSIDLLIETSAGFWIIDHKSDQTEDLDLRFARYLPQLECYSEAIVAARPDKPVLGVGINWISSGSVSLLAAS